MYVLFSAFFRFDSGNNVDLLLLRIELNLILLLSLIWLPRLCLFFRFFSFRLRLLLLCKDSAKFCSFLLFYFRYCFVCYFIPNVDVELLLLLFRLNCNVYAQAMIRCEWKLDIIVCHWAPRVCIENIIEAALISQTTICCSAALHRRSFESPRKLFSKHVKYGKQKHRWVKCTRTNK